jgi:hypothetical protein
MNPFLSNKTRLMVPFALAALPAMPSVAGPFSLISGSEQMVAVSSRVFGGYVRSRLPDGTFRPETYAFGNGGRVGGEAIDADVAGVGANGDQAGSAVSDETIDNLTFGDIARTVSVSLAGQACTPIRGPDSTNLLIMVYWGRTVGSLRSFEGAAKDKTDARNAILLGFDSEHVFAQGFNDPSNMMAKILREVHSDVLDAIQADRYFVILRAFDFQSAWKQKKIKLLWETRFSLSERLHDFTKELPGMAQYASKYFGQDSHGLLRAPVPEGRVDIGDVKSLGTVPEK